MPKEVLVTAPDLLKMKGKEPIVCLTAYDYPFAALAQSAGVDLILVGDSVGTTMLGYSTTIPVSLEQMEHHTAAVAKAHGRALIVADMPFGSYGGSVEQAVNSAVRLVKAGAHAVKLEGAFVEEIQAIVEIGVPVMGHVGMTPQSIHRFGGFKVQGKSDAGRDEILMAAHAIEAAGAFAIVVELVPSSVTQQLTAELTVPTIGIGAGPHCDGQIQVMHDILGLSDQEYKHTKRFAEVRLVALTGMQDYAKSVKTGAFPPKD